MDKENVQITENFIGRILRVVRNDLKLWIRCCAFLGLGIAAVVVFFAININYQLGVGTHNSAEKYPRPLQSDFIRTTWVEGGSDRGAMVDDLTLRILKPEMSKAQVIGLLGDPEADDWHENAYYIGCWSGPPGKQPFVDASFLVVFYDTLDRFEKACVMHMHY